MKAKSQRVSSGRQFGPFESKKVIILVKFENINFVETFLCPLKKVSNKVQNSLEW